MNLKKTLDAVSRDSYGTCVKRWGQKEATVSTLMRIDCGWILPVGWMYTRSLQL